MRRYGCFGTTPGQPAPSWLHSAATPRELAEAIDVPPGNLESTLDDWNKMVADGSDTAFGRGESVYDGWSGDQTYYGTPKATLGELEEPPFYATRVYPSALGTSGGPRTTTTGQVIDVDGAPIPGLYAAGNAMASVLGMTYGGAGGTIGPAMVFGQLAGKHIGREERT